ncbi:hypothetical protein NE237_000743 [Protea cynaroides]|uniref:Uncharacterized protein n=1 Tax=Protea cynaroides TaxID=273540 RepID=A0A9Q0KRS5_9MAGN|nr:hypothetical protein NE237_000743 [Protea cynaroides]
MYNDKGLVLYLAFDPLDCRALHNTDFNISACIREKDKTTWSFHTLRIRNAKFYKSRGGGIYIHHFKGFDWFGIPLQGKNSIEISISTCIRGSDSVVLYLCDWKLVLENRELEPHEQPQRPNQYSSTEGGEGDMDDEKSPSDETDEEEEEEEEIDDEESSSDRTEEKEEEIDDEESSSDSEEEEEEEIDDEKSFSNSLEEEFPFEYSSAMMVASPSDHTEGGEGDMDEEKSPSDDTDEQQEEEINDEENFSLESQLKENHRLEWHRYDYRREQEVITTHPFLQKRSSSDKESQMRSLRPLINNALLNVGKTKRGLLKDKMLLRDIQDFMLDDDEVISPPPIKRGLVEGSSNTTFF